MPEPMGAARGSSSLLESEKRGRGRPRKFTTKFAGGAADAGMAEVVVEETELLPLDGVPETVPVVCNQRMGIFHVRLQEVDCQVCSCFAISH